MGITEFQFMCALIVAICLGFMLGFSIAFELFAKKD